LPSVDVPAPDLPDVPVEPEVRFDHFESLSLNPVYQWLRTPWPEEWLSLRERPGFLRLRGMESPGSLYRQALVARRQVDHAYEAETLLEFEPGNFQQMAGLICYYNSTKFHYLYISRDEEIGRHLGIMSCQGDFAMKVEFADWERRTRVADSGPLRLRVRVDQASLDFYWAHLDGEWHQVGPTLDASVLSDEAGKGEGAHFTGAFVGLCAHDLTGMRQVADFDYFSYRPLAASRVQGGSAATD
jgi:xylan 1,4-beta-xylosidase